MEEPLGVLDADENMKALTSELNQLDCRAKVHEMNSRAYKVFKIFEIGS